MLSSFYTLNLHIAHKKSCQANHSGILHYLKPTVVGLTAFEAIHTWVEFNLAFHFFLLDFASNLRISR